MISKFSVNTWVTATIVSGIAIAATGPAGGQTVIGNHNNAPVSVDLSVLDQFGGARTGTQLLHPSVRTLMMPSGRQPLRSRFTLGGRSQLKPSSTPAGIVHLNPPKKAREQSILTKPRVKRKSLPKQPITLLAEPKKPLPPQIVTKAKLPPPPAINLSKPKAKAPRAPKEVAALTSRPLRSGDNKPGRQFRLGFSVGSAAINEGAATQLDTVAKLLKQDKILRLQLLAYAGDGDHTPSQARRLSLSRALAARSQLIEKGIPSTRIDVRALGNKSEGGPPNRIDIILKTR
ncbi:MAG: OmpA family protein [Pseudomonadota bacterium]|nr:OmpA family protein [Pseudomonadota bacterium]